MINIIIADDQQLFRKGFAMVLETIDNVRVMAEAGNGEELLKILEEKTPDIVFLDIDMPGLDGIGAARVLVRQYPDVKIIVLTMYEEESYFKKMEEIGVRNYMIKNSTTEEVSLAIHTVMNNKNYISQGLLQQLLAHQSSENGGPVKLTEREAEILQYIVKGFKNREIGEQLFLSKRTIERHRANLMQKTGAKNSISLITYALKNKLVNLDSTGVLTGRN